MSTATDTTVTVVFDPNPTSLQADIIGPATTLKAGVMTAAMVVKLDGIVPSNIGVGIAIYTNLTRPAPTDPIFADAIAGGLAVMIWNSDDKAPNFTDGVNWYDADGNLTNQ